MLSLYIEKKYDIQGKLFTKKELRSILKYDPYSQFTFRKNILELFYSKQIVHQERTTFDSEI